jgi:heat-inducible transcriptional repressor
MSCIILKEFCYIQNQYALFMCMEYSLFHTMAQRTSPTLLEELDARSRDIFRQIVDGYLESGEPVGSRSIARRLSARLSPATVRNVMSDLEEMGLIYAPHISAGRLPTEIGLRFFVDSLLEFGDLSPQDKASIEQKFSDKPQDQAIEHVLNQASTMLSGLTGSASLVLSSSNDVRLKHIEFVRLEPCKGLVILVSETGDVENRLIDLPQGLPSSVLIEAGNYANTHLRGKTLKEAAQALQSLISQQQQTLDHLAQEIVTKGLAVWSQESDAAKRKLIIRGRSNLLDDMKEAEDLERIRKLFDDLEAKNDLMQLLDLTDRGDGVRIFIGSENKLFSLSGSSVIVAPYRDEKKRIVGALGVIGPTRLNYARVVPVVDYTARLVGKALSQET